MSEPPTSDHFRTITSLTPGGCWRCDPHHPNCVCWPIRVFDYHPHSVEYIEQPPTPNIARYIEFHRERLEKEGRMMMENHYLKDRAAEAALHGTTRHRGTYLYASHRWDAENKYVYWADDHEWTCCGAYRENDPGCETYDANLETADQLQKCMGKWIKTSVFQEKYNNKKEISS